MKFDTILPKSTEKSLKLFKKNSWASVTSQNVQPLFVMVASCIRVPVGVSVPLLWIQPEKAVNGPSAGAAGFGLA